MKKANLSIEHIVAVIIAISVLGFLLFFIQNEFSQTSEIINDEIKNRLFEETKEKIILEFESKNIAITASPKLITAKQGEIKRIIIGIKNINNEETNFNISIKGKDWFKYNKKRTLKPDEISFIISELNVPPNAIKQNYNFQLFANEYKEDLFLTVK